jgi:hypothetical protein
MQLELYKLMHTSLLDLTQFSDHSLALPIRSTISTLYPMLEQSLELKLVTAIAPHDAKVTRKLASPRSATIITNSRPFHADLDQLSSWP